MSEVKKVAGFITISKEMLAPYTKSSTILGLTPLTPEERAEMDARRERGVAETAEFIAGLDAIEDPVIRAVLDLHGPKGRGPHCEGCDPGAYAEDSAWWPCSTTHLIAEHHDIPVPNVIYLPKEQA